MRVDMDPEATGPIKPLMTRPAHVFLGAFLVVFTRQRRALAEWWWVRKRNGGCDVSEGRRGGVGAEDVEGIARGCRRWR